MGDISFHINVGLGIFRAAGITLARIDPPTDSTLDIPDTGEGDMFPVRLPSGKPFLQATNLCYKRNFTSGLSSGWG